MKRFIPDFYIENIFLIKDEFFKEHNIRLVLSDLDNTLDAFDVLDPSPRVRELKSRLDAIGVELVIVSNNKAKRKKIYADNLNIKSKFSCGKPFSKKILKFIEELGYQKEECLLIGDQLLTDVQAGKNGKIKVCLTDPISKKDQWTTHFNRMIDRPLRKSLKKKGKLEKVKIHG